MAPPAPTIHLLAELAADIGRLRRRFNSNADTWAGGYIVDRIAANLETIITGLEPTAAELAATTAPGDEQAISEAIRIVDERAQRLQRLLGEPA